MLGTPDDPLDPGDSMKGHTRRIGSSRWKCRTLFALGALSVTSLLSSGVQAEDQQNLNEAILEILYQDGTISEVRYRELLNLAQPDSENLKKSETADDKSAETDAETDTPKTVAKDKAAQNEKVAEAAKATPPAKKRRKFKVETGWNGLRVTSEDGANQFRVGGRLQSDFAVYEGGSTPMNDGTEIRRARIKTQGKLMSDWEYKLEVNFDPDTQVSLTDAWISYKGLRPGGVPINLTAGHLKVPFSQQSMSSSNWQVFQERALIDSFIDNKDFGRRRLGGIIESYGEHWFAALGMYSEGPNPGDRQTEKNNESFGVATRIGLLPFIEDRKLLSINGGVYYRGFDSDAVLKFAARPESHVTNTKLVNTGDITNINSVLLYNMSITGLLGSFHAQAEYTGALVERRGGQSTLSFGGFYVQAGYFLTGENRRYDQRFGKYRRVKPNQNFSLRSGGWGAWEVAARFSQISLQNQDIAGGREYDVTLGLNWYVNPSILFRLNYVAAMTHPTANSLGAINEQINVFEGRMQVVF